MADGAADKCTELFSDDGLAEHKHTVSRPNIVTIGRADDGSPERDAIQLSNRRADDAVTDSGAVGSSVIKSTDDRSPDGAGDGDHQRDHQFHRDHGRGSRDRRRPSRIGRVKRRRRKRRQSPSFKCSASSRGGDVCDDQLLDRRVHDDRDRHCDDHVRPLE